MASELLKTVGGYELWGDPTLVELDKGKNANDSTKNFFLNITLKNHYFINPIRFTLKRPTRNDYNFDYNVSPNFVDSVRSITNNGLNYPIGVVNFNVGIDSSFNKIEIVVDPEHIESRDGLPPEMVTLQFPSPEYDYHYDNLVKDGKIDVLVNDTKLNIITKYKVYEVLEEVEVIAYEPLKVTIVNNQLASVFDLEEIDFRNITPDVATIDLIEWNIDRDNWDSMISYNTFTMLPDIINFTARPTEPTVNYPFLKLYELSDDELKKLSTELINYNANPDNEDLTGYVNNLIRVPYPIKSGDETVGIQVYNKGFTATGNLIDDYIQEIKLGRIKCSHEMLTGIGYKNIEFTLHVPYFKPITLEVHKVIDRYLDLILKLDLTNGQGTLNVLIDGTTHLVENQKIAKDIPFRANNININLDDTIYNNTFKYPYVTVTVLNPDNTIDSKELKQRKINKTTLSYVKSDNIHLSSKATYLEQIEIDYLIRKGVFINGNN